MVVEDEALILFTIADELRAAGYTVLEATDADTALDLLERYDDIRLVFTDIDMPGSMDGLRLSSVIRDRWPPVRIIVTSGKAAPRASAMPGGSRFLPKPYSPTTLLDTVHAMLN
jgi:two-component system, response regulator PdtaR